MRPFWVDELVESCELQDGDMVLDAVLLLRVARADDDSEGGVALAIGRTKGCDWIVESGLINAAHTVMSSPDGIQRPE